MGVGKWKWSWSRSKSRPVTQSSKGSDPQEQGSIREGGGGYEGSDAGSCYKQHERCRVEESRGVKGGGCEVIGDDDVEEEPQPREKDHGGSGKDEKEQGSGGENREISGFRCSLDNKTLVDIKSESLGICQQLMVDIVNKCVKYRENNQSSSGNQDGQCQCCKKNPCIIVEDLPHDIEAVSYTHLTLPTICSV